MADRATGRATQIACTGPAGGGATGFGTRLWSPSAVNRKVTSVSTTTSPPSLVNPPEFLLPADYLPTSPTLRDISGALAMSQVQGSGH